MSIDTYDEAPSPLSYGETLPPDTSKTPALALLRACLTLSPDLPTRVREVIDEWRITAGAPSLLIFLEAEIERVRRIDADELTEAPNDDRPLVADYLRAVRRDGLNDR